MTMTLRVPLLACVFLAAATATAADWPGFRGANRDGYFHRNRAAEEVGRTAARRRPWTATNLGTGWGTPSVADGKIFGIGTREGKDGVWALDESNGKELWFTPFADPAEKLLKQTNGPSSTPTIHAGKVFAVSANGTLSCLDATKGKLVWKVNYVSDFGGKVPAWAYTESVLVDGDKVNSLPGGNKGAVAALNANTGESHLEDRSEPGRRRVRLLVAHQGDFWWRAAVSRPPG